MLNAYAGGNDARFVYGLSREDLRRRRPAADDTRAIRGKSIDVYYGQDLREA
ncbi:MAG: hypothetical protein QGF67_11740 [Lentisphaeria bacterium]|jgi:hypothetical protein|nr:hypothetical protein [Lentisphaeria bacterium]MDP7742107.1 hypothetical protein [Lentisphaeria bacterium]